MRNRWVCGGFKQKKINQMKKFLLIGLTALLLLSCEESNIDENKNYIGFWTSIDGDITYTLDVLAN
jgi:hypothetical protein